MERSLGRNVVQTLRTAGESLTIDFPLCGAVAALEELSIPESTLIVCLPQKEKSDFPE